jgi:hypothetical protein
MQELLRPASTRVTLNTYTGVSGSNGGRRPVLSQRESRLGDRRRN